MMTKEEKLTLRDALKDYKAGHVALDYVEAHVACLIEEAEERIKERLALALDKTVAAIR